MSEYNDYDELFDVDPADCNSSRVDTETANEFGETPVEYSAEDTEAASEFTETPIEFGVETAVDSDVQDYEVTESSLSDDADTEYGTSPQDETAATSDELYTTHSARADCMLDDYEIISDVLGSEKELVKLYSTALCEASEENFRDIIRENLIECAADQYSTYEYMEKRGMYPLDEAEEEKITKAKQQFTPLCACHD